MIRVNGTLPTPPTVTSIERQMPTASPTNVDSLTWRVTFSKAASNVDAADFTIDGTTATPSVTAVSSSVYDVTASGGNLADLDATVTLAFASGQDVVTNTTPTGTNDPTFVVDNTAPRVASFRRYEDSPINTPGGSGNSMVAWVVTFSEVVQHVDAADFTRTGTTATISLDPAPTIYKVVLSGGDLVGLNNDVTLAFASGQNVADLAGNPLANTAPTGLNQPTVTVDNIRPTVTISGVPAASSGPFTATFTFSEPVIGFQILGEPRAVTVSNGTASDLTGSPGDTVYTVLITPTANGPVTVSVTTSTMTTGTIADLAGNPYTAAAQATSTYAALGTITVPTFPAEATTRGFTETIGGATVTTAGDVGTPVAARDDDTLTLTYTLEGTDAASFTIGATTGQIRTRVGQRYDREAKASYAVTVTASDGSDSDTIAVTIVVNNAVEKPLQMARPRVLHESTMSLSVSWTAPNNTGRPAITSYDVQYRVTFTTAWMNGPQGVTGTSTTITGLAANTEYVVQVRATNADGDGPWSDGFYNSTDAQFAGWTCARTADGIRKSAIIGLHETELRVEEGKDIVFRVGPVDPQPTPSAGTRCSVDPANPWVLEVQFTHVTTESPAYEGAEEMVKSGAGRLTETLLATQRIEIHNNQPVAEVRIPTVDDVTPSRDSTLEVRLVRTSETHQLIHLVGTELDVELFDRDPSAIYFDYPCDEGLTVTEGVDEFADVRLRREPPADYAESVVLFTDDIGGTATAGGDYVGETGANRLRFFPGETTAVRQVRIQNDETIEDPESFRLLMFSPGSRDTLQIRACLGPDGPQGSPAELVITIRDDDAPVTLDLGPRVRSVRAGDSIRFAADVPAAGTCRVPFAGSVTATPSGATGDLTSSDDVTQEWTSCPEELPVFEFTTPERTCARQGARAVRFRFAGTDERIGFQHDEYVVYVDDAHPQDYARNFTTGSNTHGYRLDSVTLQMTTQCPLEAPWVEIWSADGTPAPSGNQWSLLRRAGRAGTHDAPDDARIKLEPDTTYFLVATAAGAAPSGSKPPTTVGGTDVTSLGGWTFGSRRYERYAAPPEPDRSPRWDAVELEENRLTFTLTATELSAPPAAAGEPATADVDWKTSFTVGHYWQALHQERERGFRRQYCFQTREIDAMNPIQTHTTGDTCYGTMGDVDFVVDGATYTLEGIYHFVEQYNDSLHLDFTSAVDLSKLEDKTFVINGRDFPVSKCAYPQKCGDADAFDDGETGTSLVWAEPLWDATMGWTHGSTIWIGLKAASSGAQALPNVEVTRTSEGEVHGPFAVQVAFTADVSGFEAADVAVDNATIEDFTKVDARTWTARIVPSASGTVTVSVPADAAQSGSLGNAASPPLTVDADLSVPTVTLSTAATEPVSDEFTVRVTFSKTVTGFSLEDVAIEGGEPVGMLSIPGEPTHDVLIMPASDAAQVTVRVPAGAVTDLAERPNTASNTLRVRAAGPPSGAAVPDPEPGLSASFHDVPSEHDGRTAFTFELRFSEHVPGLSYRTLRPEKEKAAEGAFTVTNGTVKKARRLERGQNQRWAITVEPTASDKVTITLPATTDCADTGAICTPDGTKKLAAAVSATVAGAPLTAAFWDKPAEHDGRTAFTFELRFNQHVRGLSYRTLQPEKEKAEEGAFTVTNGTVEKAWRLERGQNRRWKIRVEPAGLADVTIELPATTACSDMGAICTPDGRMLSNASSMKVLGPHALSVADAHAKEGTDATLDFVVRLSRVSSETVTVDFKTVDGTASAGQDYTAASGTLTFLPGETKQTVSVAVLIDAHNEDEERLTLRLSNARHAAIADAEATGTISNSGPLQQAWLGRFGRTVGSQVLDAVSQRLDASPSPHLRIGGVDFNASPLADTHLAPDLPAGWEAERQRPEGRTLSDRELLLGSSFHLVSQAAENGGMAISAWGRVSSSHFRAEVDAVTLRGDVTTGLLGFDAEWERLLAGLVLARSEGDGAYDQRGGDRGALESSLTGVYPYARLRLGDRVSAWGLAGVGSGDLTLIRQDEVIDTGMGLQLGAIGVQGTLLGGGVLDLAVRSDALWVRTDSDAATGLAAASAQTSRVRIILEGGRSVALPSGAVLTPTVQIGLRHDGGDAETGTGVEVGTGIAYSAGLLTVDVQVRTLLAHESAGYEEWGASGAIRLSPGALGLGPSLAVLPSWGVPGSGVERLWSQADASALTQGGAPAPASGRLDAEVGYGLPALRGRGVLTPYARVALAEGDGRSWHVGARLALAAALDLSLEGSGRRLAGAESAHDLTLRASLPW